jgi:hypothetical protein
MEHPMRKTLISALAAGLIVLTAPAAHATTRDVTDPAGDVMTATLNSDGDVVKYNREGGAEGDITFARIQHTATAVVVYLRYAQLSVPKQYASFQYDIVGNNGGDAVVEIDTRHGLPQGEAFVEFTGRHCGLSYHINYAGDSVSMRIPRACVNKARYVRLGHVSLSVTVKPDGSGKVYYDSPARDGGTRNQVYNAYTPWVITG